MLYAVLAALVCCYLIGRYRPLAHVKANAWENVVWAHYMRRDVSKASASAFVLLYPYVSIFKGWHRAVRPELPGRASVDLADEFAARFEGRGVRG